MKLCFRNVKKHYLKYTSVGNEMTLFKGVAGTLRQAEYALDFHLHALDSIRSSSFLGFQLAQILQHSNRVEILVCGR